jgi:hypothetical protein
VNYRASRFSRESVSESSESLRVQAGDRAPDCSGLVRANIRYPYRLFDITRGVSHVILLYLAKFAEPGQLELVEKLSQKLTDAQSLPCRLVLITSPDAQPRDVIGATILKDCTAEFSSAYTPEVNTGYIIRPDRYVGYHGRPLTVHGVDDYLAAVVGSEQGVQEKSA